MGALLPRSAAAPGGRGRTDVDGNLCRGRFCLCWVSATWLPAGTPLTEAKLGCLATTTHGRASLSGQEHPGNRQNAVSFQRDSHNYGETVPSLSTATAGGSISSGPSGRVFFPLPQGLMVARCRNRHVLPNGLYENSLWKWMSFSIKTNCAGSQVWVHLISVECPKFYRGVTVRLKSETRATLHAPFIFYTKPS